MGANWTDERVDALKKLWAEGHSCSHIGGRFGISRNAVIGKVHRLGLPPRATLVRRKIRTRSPWRKPDARRHNGALRRKPNPPLVQKPSPIRLAFKAEPIPPRSTPIADVSRVKSLLDLEAHHCRWICSDAGYCGAHHVPGTSWCLDHLRVVYSPPKPNPRFIPSEREKAMA